MDHSAEQQHKKVMPQTVAVSTSCTQKQKKCHSRKIQLFEL